MNPLLLAIPVGVGILYLVWPKGATGAPVVPWGRPPAGPTAVTAGGSRAISYLQRLGAALLAYRAVKFIGGTAAASALSELRGTLDVVKGMAEEDLLKGRIVQQDMTAINARMAEIRKEIGG